MLDDEYCEWFPEDPECERESGAKPPTADLRATMATNASVDFDAEQGLNGVLDTENPPVGAGGLITYVIRYRNDGVGAAPGLVADVTTWGPV